MEKSIGTTELRQKLTDVLHQVQEQGASYLLETFGRPQAVIVNLDVYRQYQKFNEKRESFLDWLEDVAAQNATHTNHLSEDDVLSAAEQTHEYIAGAGERQAEVENNILVQFTLPARQFVAEPIEDVTEKVRLYAALGMYRSGKISIGAACELAGVNRYVFLDFCKRENVPLRTQTPEELETEFHQIVG